MSFFWAIPCNMSTVTSGWSYNLRLLTIWTIRSMGGDFIGGAIGPSNRQQSKIVGGFLALRSLTFTSKMLEDDKM